MLAREDRLSSPETILTKERDKVGIEDCNRN